MIYPLSSMLRGFVDFRTFKQCMSLRGAKRRGNLLLECPYILQEIATSPPFLGGSSQ